MKKLLNYYKFINPFVNLYILIFSQIFLLCLNGCSFKIAENKKEEEWYARCGTTYKGYSVNFKRLENRMSYRYLLSFARYEDSTKSLFSGYYFPKMNHHSYFFVIGDNDLEYELSKFQDSLKNASAELSVYIYINTINQEHINQTFKQLTNAQQKVLLLNIHSDKISKVYIPHISKFEYLAISGNVKECIIGKNTFPNCVNLFNAENIKKIEFSSDSIQYLRIEGALPSEKFVEAVCNNSKRLDTVQLFHNRLEKMPDLGLIKKLKVLTYFDQDFDKIDLNRMPKQVEYFNLNFIKTKDIVLNKNEKIVKLFNFDGSVVPNLFEALVTLVPE